MTKEDRQLLFADLCTRLPYDVLVDYDGHIYILNEINPACKDIDYITVHIQDVERLMCAKSVMIENIKPYLRPMSSMTEDEEEEYRKINLFGTHWGFVDWCNKKHFDYRGLIPLDLAIEVTKENNPYRK